jgi:DNA-binding NtrC family response regulator
MRRILDMPVQTAMVIDDDQDFNELLSLQLERRKIHVLSVFTLQEAEDYLSYLKPSVVFLDNSFPEGLGINFIRFIKSIDENIKVVMMTGDRAQWIHEKAIEEGIDYFLRKPLRKEDVESVLDELKFKKVPL